MSEWPPPEVFPDRRRPHRLPPEEYKRIGQPVFFASCAGDRRPIMLQRGLPGALTILLDQSAQACGCGVIAYTIMPDHLHVLACVVRDGGDVLSFFKEFKRSAALAAMRRGFHDLWQRDFWDRHTRNSHDLKRCVTYVLWNAVAEGLCKDAHDWPWTDFRGWPWTLVEEAAMCDDVLDDSSSTSGRVGDRPLQTARITADDNDGGATHAQRRPG